MRQDSVSPVQACALFAFWAYKPAIPGKQKSRAPDAIHSHNASDITDGTLAVARGGTGVTTAAVYWAAINSLAFPFTFAYQPSVSVSASGSSNFFTWASNVTTTATGQIYVGRGTLASGVNTRLCITVTGIYS